MPEYLIQAIKDYKEAATNYISALNEMLDCLIVYSEGEDEEELK